jgi:hypothetical protein
MKVLLLIAVFIFACSKPAIKHDIAIDQASSETRNNLEIQSGQSVLEAAMEYHKKQSKNEAESTIAGADSIITTKMLPDGTTETTKFYNPKTKKDKNRTNDIDETQKNTTTAKTEETKIKKDSTDKKESLNMAEKTEEKQVLGLWDKIKYKLSIIGLLALLFVAWNIGRGRI